MILEGVVGPTSVKVLLPLARLMAIWIHVLWKHRHTIRTSEIQRPRPGDVTGSGFHPGLQQQMLHLNILFLSVPLCWGAVLTSGFWISWPSYFLSSSLKQELEFQKLKFKTSQPQWFDTIALEILSLISAWQLLNGAQIEWWNFRHGRGIEAHLFLLPSFIKD